MKIWNNIYAVGFICLLFFVFVPVNKFQEGAYPLRFLLCIILFFGGSFLFPWETIKSWFKGK